MFIIFSMVSILALVISYIVYSERVLEAVVKGDLRAAKRADAVKRACAIMILAIVVVLIRTA